MFELQERTVYAFKRKNSGIDVFLLFPNRPFADYKKTPYSFCFGAGRRRPLENVVPDVFGTALFRDELPFWAVVRRDARIELLTFCIGDFRAYWQSVAV